LCGPDIRNHGILGGKYQAVKNLMLLKGAQGWRGPINGNKICQAPHCDASGIAAKGPCPAPGSTEIEGFADGALIFHQHIAGQIAQALRIFQHAQFLGERDIHV